MKVTIDIDEKYAGVLSLTVLAAGERKNVNVSVGGVDLSRGTHITVNNDGTIDQDEEHAE